MKRKLKKGLFQAYEKEMRFRDGKEKVKSCLTFEKKPKRFDSFGYRCVLAGATCAVVCALSVSSHFAFSPMIRSADHKRDTEAENEIDDSRSEEVSYPVPSNGSIETIDGVFDFGEGNCYSVFYSFSPETNKVRFQDKGLKMNLDELVLKEEGSILEHIDEEEHAFSIQFTSYRNHNLIWEYRSDSGTLEF